MPARPHEGGRQRTTTVSGGEGGSCVAVPSWCSTPGTELPRTAQYELARISSIRSPTLTCTVVGGQEPCAVVMAPKSTLICLNPSERSIPVSMPLVFFCASASSGLCLAASWIFCWAAM